MCDPVYDKSQFQNVGKLLYESREVVKYQQFEIDDIEQKLFAYVKKKAQISCVVTAQLISTFVFATWIVKSLSFLNLKFQASSQLLWLYSLVFVGPGRKPRRQVFLMS